MDVIVIWDHFSFLPDKKVYEYRSIILNRYLVKNCVLIFISVKILKFLSKKTNNMLVWLGLGIINARMWYDGTNHMRWDPVICIN